jgi:hypothetical protein
VRDGEEMREIRVARTAELVTVAFGGDFVGPADQPRIFRGAILTELLEECFEARV